MRKKLKVWQNRRDLYNLYPHTLANTFSIYNMVLAASRMHLDGKLQLIGSGGKGGLKGNRYSDTPSFKRTDIQREYSFSCLPNAIISIFLLAS
jgi:DNA-directed RNA polymerase beta' subunit